MRAIRWFSVVAVVTAIGLMGRTMYAQGTSPAVAASGVVAADPAVATAPPAVDPQNCNNGAIAGNACCELPCWHVFGEFLLLRPRNEGIDYAVPINGPIVVDKIPIQVGPTAALDPQYAPGFRLGFERVLDQCSSISLDYAYYRNDANSGPVTVAAPFVLQSMVFNPSSADAATNFNSASAHKSSSFNLVDLDYHHNLWSCDGSSINYLIGARFAQLAQEFDANFKSIISASANSSVEFDGVGLRLGLDGERTIRSGFFLTFMANANLLGGQYSGFYTQSNTNSPIVDTTNLSEGRFLTILEAQVAVGWQSSDGHIRTSVGYLVSGWIDVVKPSDFIASMQANQYVGTNQVGNTSLVFDGFTARLELAW